MAVVWGTVKDHKGYISVDSELTRGSTIAIYFPATRKPLGDDGETERLEDFLGDGETILVVDDVEDQRQIATEMLT